jgi:transposase-like protein
MRKNYTKQFKNEALNRVRRGDRRIDIATEMKISTSTLTKWAKEAGVAKTSTAQLYSDEFIQGVIDDIKNGMSFREAARKHNVSVSSIQKWTAEAKLAKKVVKTNFKTPVKTTPQKAIEIVLDNRMYAEKQVHISLTEDSKLLLRIRDR